MLLALLISCGNKEIDCSTEALPSLIITLESETGIDQPTLFYSINEEEQQPADPYANEQWVAGWEVSGTIRIAVEANICPEDPDCICLAQKNTEVLIPLTENGCHVDTQEITLTFSEEDIIDRTCLDE